MTTREHAGGAAWWASTLLLAAGLYLCVALLSEWDFLPWFGTHPLDTRWLVCSGVDKLDELRSALEFSATMSATWGTMVDALRGAALDPVRADFNPIPKALIWLGQLVLPSIWAYNLLVLLVWVANGLAVAALALRLSGSRGGALLAGFLFAFSPLWVSVLHCRSLDYGMFFFVPLLLLVLVQLRSSPRLGWVVALALGLALLVLANQYYTLGLALVLLGWLVAALALGPSTAAEPGRASLLAKLCLGGLGAALILSPWLFTEWRLLQVQQLAMDPADSNVGRSFFQPLAVRAGLGPGLGLAWCWLVGLLGAVGLVFGPRAHRVERILLGGGALALVLAQQQIAEHALVVAQALWELPVLWRVRACRLAATLLVFLAATLAGVGFATLWRRAASRGGRLVLAAVVVGACALSLREGRRWWDESCLASATPIYFSDELFGRLHGLRPSPTLVILEGPARRDDLPQALSGYFEIRAGIRPAPPGPQQDLERRLAAWRSGAGVPAARPAGPGGSRCQLVLLDSSQGSGFDAQSAAEALGALGFDRVLAQEAGWTVAHDAGCAVSASASSR